MMRQASLRNLPRGAALAWYISPVDREARVVAFHLKRNTSYRSAYTLDSLGSFLADRLPVNGSPRALSHAAGPFLAQSVSVVHHFHSHYGRERRHRRSD